MFSTSTKIIRLFSPVDDTSLDDMVTIFPVPVLSEGNGRSEGCKDYGLVSMGALAIEMRPGGHEVGMASSVFSAKKLIRWSCVLRHSIL
jgi:hypothetical protein